MSRFTPGPWTWESGFIVAKFQTDGKVYDVCDPRCAPVECSDEMDANGDLIAAAPDMLEALKDVWDAGVFECCCGAPGGACDGTCTHTRVKLAIAKAEGKKL